MERKTEKASITIHDKISMQGGFNISRVLLVKKGMFQSLH